VTRLKTVRTDAAPAAIGPYSQAITVDGWVFCSGQIALDPASGEVVGETAAEQTERVMANLTAVLRAAGASLSDVVKTTVFLSEMADFQAMNEVYGRHFGDHRPARATVQAAGLPKSVKVEIECVAKCGENA
jgi:2-iminobutanoate/2-iminopropanoate deaminase